MMDMGILPRTPEKSSLIFSLSSVKQVLIFGELLAHQSRQGAGIMGRPGLKANRPAFDHYDLTGR